MTVEQRPPLVLASTSRTRRAILEAAGLAVEVVAPGVDEARVKAELEPRLGVLGPAGLAGHLAMTKALAVSRMRPGAVVIGGDQVLASEGVIHDKPADLAAARSQLLALRGRCHSLHSAVALARDGLGLWSHQEARADLTMRRFSDAFLDDYLARVGTTALASAGAYQIEGLGVQLFEAIEGDHFTILGLPLLPLLAELRQRGLVAE